MEEIINKIVFAIIPVLFFMGVGYFLTHKKFFIDTQWATIEKLIYYILFPALIIQSLAKESFYHEKYFAVAVALNVAQLIMFIISFFAWFKKDMNGPKFTSILQNNIMWNAYIAIAIAKEISPNYLSVVLLAITAMIPTANILSVWALLIWGKFEKGTKPSPFSGLLFNPLIIACVIGLLLQYFGTGLWQPLNYSLKLLGVSAIPLGLMAIGAGMNLQHMKNTSLERISWSLIRLILYPVTALISCHIFGISDDYFILMSMIVTAAPAASNGYILARKMGGDAPFMAALIGTTTLFSVFTIPFILWIFHYLVLK